MTDSEVQLFLADLALIIVLARLLGTAAKRIGQPPVLGEIIAGILLGPTLWGTWTTTHLFPLTMKAPLSALANLGLALFMFVVGYELDLRLVRGRERVAASVSVSSVVLPLGLGAVLGVWLASRHHVHKTLPFVLFVGTAMAVTAFPVLARILADRGMHRTRIGGLALASAAVDDVLAWSLLAVVVAIAGAGGHPLRLLLAPVYAAAMFGAVRPLLRRLAGVYQRQGRLTPQVLAAVLAGLLLSSFATDWMGVKFIFGAFLFGVVMPRDEAPATLRGVAARSGGRPPAATLRGVAARSGGRHPAATLRQEILERLEQVSVLVLLPVFFVVSGLSVNLRTVGLSGFWQLCLILVAAVAGKFGGAFAGARLAGVRGRQAGVLATLMNTRGLTGIVILSVGLQLHILDQSLYSLMIVMAIVTTAMTGPLVKIIYPDRFTRRDLAEADRAMLGTPAAHRIVVLIGRLDGAAPLVDVGAALAASREHSELVVSHLVPHQGSSRLEVGAGLGGELLEMTRTMAELQALAERAAARGVTAVVQSRFSDDIGAELPGYVAAAEPDAIVLRPDGPPREALAADGATQLVTVLHDVPEGAGTVAVQWARGADAAAALQVAAQLAAANGLHLVISPPGGRRASLAAELARSGIAASDGPPPAGAIVVAAAAEARDGAHLAVVAGTREGSDDMDQWVQSLDGRRLIEQH
jgi:Kef-type K+ transport system membrane component KefB